MSTAVKYNPALFQVQRATTVPSVLGSLILGVSKLGNTTSTTWQEVPAATFTYSSGYQRDDNGTLIIDSETASVSMSFWGDPPEPPLFSLDQVRAVYNGEVIFKGTVDSTSLTYATDPAAAEHGAVRRVDFTAALVGAYAVAMGKTVSWRNLPAETAINRVRRWVTVDGW